MSPPVDPMDDVRALRQADTEADDDGRSTEEVTA